jgi:predicted MFS family arabinose efflux permease
MRRGRRARKLAGMSFHRLAWSNLAAQSAEQIALAATPIIAVLLLNADAGGTGALQTAQTLPFLLLAIPAGLLADRLPRRLMMAGAEALRALSLFVVLLLAASGGLSLPLLGLLGLIGACGTVAYTVAAPALVPALVPRHQLARANARIELARTLAFTAGPALAGALVGWAGASITFALAAALSTLAALMLFGLREPPRPMAPKREPVRELREGVEFVLRHPLLLPVFLTQSTFNTAFFVLQAVYAPYAVHRLGLSAAGVGATLAIYGLGMVLGALLAPRIAARVSFGTLVALGPVAGLLAALAMLLTIWWPVAWLAGLSFFLIGVGPILWVISTTTLRQTVTPPQLLGRVSAINILAYGTRPIGAALGAAVGGAWGAEAAIALAAFGFLVQAMLILASPVVRLAEQPQPVG